MKVGNKYRILVIEDETTVMKPLIGWLKEQGYEVGSAGCGEETLRKLVDRRWDVFLLDSTLPDMSSLELQRRIRSFEPHASIIVMATANAMGTATKAMKQGAYDYIAKPWRPSDLEHRLRNAVERRALLGETTRLRRSLSEVSALSGIVGRSRAIRRVLEQVKLAAESDTTVLVRGESGTGKDLVAGAIHASSSRCSTPMVVVRSGSLSAGVLESDLLGHEEGRAGGARYRRRGKFELADKGTLFWDEIGDTCLKTQVDLMRVLVEKKICRVGGSRALPVDFRLIAATSKNLEGMLLDQRFRLDLYRSINVFQINVPPLRERREDIPLLVDHFLSRFSGNRRFPRISAQAMKQFENYT